jgi:hypothetical protein
MRRISHVFGSVCRTGPDGRDGNSWRLSGFRRSKVPCRSRKSAPATRQPVKTRNRNAAARHSVFDLKSASGQKTDIMQPPHSSSTFSTSHLNPSSHSLESHQGEVANITIRTASKSKSPITSRGLKENQEKFDPLLGKSKVDPLSGKSKPNSGLDDTILIEHSDEKGPAPRAIKAAGKVLNSPIMQKLNLSPALRQAKQQQVRDDYAAAAAMLLGTNKFDRAALAAAVSDQKKFTRKGLESAIHAVDPDVGIMRSKEELSDDLYARVSSVSRVVIRDPNKNPPKLHVFLADGKGGWLKPDPRNPTKTVPAPGGPIALLQQYESKDGLPRYVKVLSLDRSDSKFLHLDPYYRPPATGSTPPNTPPPLLTTKNQAVNDLLDDGDRAVKENKYAEAGKYYKEAYAAYNKLSDATDDIRKQILQLAGENYATAFDAHKEQDKPDPEIQWTLADELESVGVEHHEIEERMRGKDGGDGLSSSRLYDKFWGMSMNKIATAERMLKDKIGNEKVQRERLATDYLQIGALLKMSTLEKIEQKSITDDDKAKNLTMARSWLEKSKKKQEELDKTGTPFYAGTLMRLAETLETIRDYSIISDVNDDEITELKDKAKEIQEEVEKKAQNNKQKNNDNANSSGSSSNSSNSDSGNNASNQKQV